jgi:hypothetical protein
MKFISNVEASCSGPEPLRLETKILSSMFLEHFLWFSQPQFSVGSGYSDTKLPPLNPDLETL